MAETFMDCTFVALTNAGFRTVRFAYALDLLTFTGRTPLGTGVLWTVVVAETVNRDTLVLLADMWPVFAGTMLPAGTFSLLTSVTATGLDVGTASAIGTVLVSGTFDPCADLVFGDWVEFAEMVLQAVGDTILALVASGELHVVFDL